VTSAQSADRPKNGIKLARVCGFIRLPRPRILAPPLVARLDSMKFAHAGRLYTAASALVLLGLCGVDLWLVPGPRDVKLGVVLAALAVGVGAAQGLVWAAVIGVSQRLPLRLRAAVWCGAGLLAAGSLGQSLNAFSRLSGRYRVHALGVLGASLAGAGALAAIVFASHGAEANGVAGSLLRLRGRRRLAAALALVLGAVTLFACDRWLYVELYPQAHHALRLGTLWLCMFAVVIAAHDARWTRVPGYLWALPAFALASAALSFKPDDVAAVHALSVRPWTAFAINTAHRFTDVDRDGYSSLFGGSDCAPFDRRVHPGAPEIPNNGVDDNCVLGDARPSAAATADAPVPDTQSPIDVVLITVDSLRADHLGIYSSRYAADERGTTPALDAYAAKHCILFTHAYSPGGGTSVALPSIIRGRYPRRLRWTRYYETNRFNLVRGLDRVPKDETVSSMFPLAYDDPSLSIAEWLSRRGMYTVAVLDDGFSEMLSKGTGVERGFARFVQVDSLPPSRRDDRGTAETLVRQLKAAPPDRRLFAWAHFFGPHGPNERHPGARVYGDSLSDGYDHEINYFDQQLTRVLSVLGAWPRPIAVFITADHGDVLANGRYHGYTLRDDVTRVPLLACVSGWTPTRVAQVVSSLDIVPTILALTETPAPHNLDGVDLADVIDGYAPSDRIVLSDSWLFASNGAPRINLVSARDDSNRVTKDLIAGLPFFDPLRPRSAASVALSPLLRWIDAYLEETSGVIDLHP
jgi:hypothetical protein